MEHEETLPARDDISRYHFDGALRNCAHEYLLPSVEATLRTFFSATSMPKRVFDVGCGNGSVMNWLDERGYDTTGVDPSIEGIEQARKAYPKLKIETGSTNDDLAKKYGTFPAVLSLEVVEHVFAPRDFARRIFDLVEPGGLAIISTPYHGYLKNLSIAVLGEFDRHVNPLWDHGHIKFWSVRTLGTLLRETGFRDIEFHRVGRWPPFAKSMIAVARKPLVGRG